MSFFSPQSASRPSGLFNPAHLIYIIVTLTAVFTALYLTRRISESHCLTVIRVVAVTLLVIEAIKIIFVLCTSGRSDLNSYVPLYFCSIEIYAAMLAAFAAGRLKRIGEVFMMTGGVIGGIFFIAYPLSSLSFYPAAHLISLQSFVFHGIMLYVGLLMLMSGYRKLRARDIGFYAIAVFAVSVVALIFNLSLGTNFMFISQNYPGTFIEPIYNALPLPIFTVLAVAAQATLPFLLCFGIYKLAVKLAAKKQSSETAQK